MGKANLRSAAFLLLVIPSFAMGQAAVGDGGPAGCATMRAAFKAMLESEYAFGQKAQTSVNGAFLEYLADDSWVLNPGPVPGRPIYQSAKENKNTLEWYPAIGDIAPSGDLGFTAGPWVYTINDSGKQFHGHFLTVWKRDASVPMARGVRRRNFARDAAKSPSLKLLPDQAPICRDSNVRRQIWLRKMPRVMRRSIFKTRRDETVFAAALRTYGRDFDFVFFTDEQSPIGGAGAASDLSYDHPIAGAWKEVAAVDRLTPP